MSRQNSKIININKRKYRNKDNCRLKLNKKDYNLHKKNSLGIVRKTKNLQNR